MNVERAKLEEEKAFVSFNRCQESYAESRKTWGKKILLVLVCVSRDQN